ncbi:MAG: alpha-galactosidase [Ginsengibacter sp.]
MKYSFCLLVFFYFQFQGFAQSQQTRVRNSHYSVAFAAAGNGFSYQLLDSKTTYNFSFPSFEINGKQLPLALTDIKESGAVTVLSNGVSQYQYEGSFKGEPSLQLQIIFQVSPGNAVLRFQYELKTAKRLKLTKANGEDHISYISVASISSEIKEVRLSEFNERFHATNKTEYIFDKKYFDNEATFMGPIAVATNGRHSFLLAYEHGSQFPNRFLQFQLHKNKTLSIEAVKGNYLSDEQADGFTSVWFEAAAMENTEEELAKNYRTFILKYITQNSESRKPYIFYNTWGRQERVHWAGEKYLASMNLQQTLKEIDQAHAMGVEVFVLDAGWFIKTGDWEVNTTFFPDSLKQVRAKLEGYGMKLGLWFNPTVAAVSGDMYQQNLPNRMSYNGRQGEPAEIWETEKSVGLCLVSSYWEEFADKLISLTKTLGVSYFKWDAIGQYGCNDAHHYHGTAANTLEERTQRYAFLQPLYMTKIIDKVCKAAPQSIFDFDITEDGRCVGLQFLSAGKYFIINNGPYYHNFDLAPIWKSILPNDNANIFVQPGPARGWFVRSVLNYDKWIPSVLFLTHYQPDEPHNSQLINLASLILGQNGIWGEILKTSDEGVRFFDTVLTNYKSVREDITEAQMIYTGEPGGSPEIYEKINKETGKGCVVIFANAKGTYNYITENKVAASYWSNEGVKLGFDKKGRANITVEFDKPSAKIIFFNSERFISGGNN